MPNWCTNYLYLKSDREQSVDEFLTDFKSSGEFEMKNILPVPEELLNPDTTCYGGPLEEQEQREQLKRDLKAKYGYASWYDFCVDVWGTKWDISNPDDDFYLDSNFCYSTAWGPNATFFYNISERYPDVEFSLYYIEPGMAFAGVYSVKNGNVLQDDVYQAADELDTKNLLDFINNNEHAFGDADSWFSFFSNDEMEEEAAPIVEQNTGDNYEMEL